jgi:hypothetical protein
MSVPQILIFMLRHWFTCSQKPLVYLSLFIAQLPVPDECPAAQKLSSTSMTLPRNSNRVSSFGENRILFVASPLSTHH